jgi:telomerase protein component 1
MAMLRNLRNMILTGISRRHHRWVMSKLKDEQTVANSRQFPFSFFTAYEAIDIDLEQLKKDIEEAKSAPAKARGAKALRGGRGGARGGRGAAVATGTAEPRKKKVIIPVNMPTPELIQEYKAALDTSVKYATVHNVKPIRGSTLVLCSVSASMRNGALSGRSIGRVKSLVEVGVLLGLMCKYMCEECDFRIFSSAKRGNSVSHESVELRDGTILDNMAVVMNSMENLGTDFVFPFAYLEDLILQNKKIDNIIVLSDQHIAPGYNELIGSGPAAGGISGILTKYRQEINPDLLYVSVNLAGRTSVDVDDSKRHVNDIVVSGFSDSILRYVAERGDGNQLEYIQHIDVAKNLDALTAKLELRLNRAKIEARPSSFWSFVDNVQNCTWEGCPAKLKKEQLAQHIKDCPYRIVKCTEPECTEKIPHNQLEIHVARCFFRKISSGESKKWRNVRVFVSSTFLDMHGERDVLTREVFPEIREYCRKKNVHFFDVDLRWGVTEEESNSSSTIDVCLSEVDKCRPFFIGMLGDRYGWVPDKYVNSGDPSLSWLSEYPAGRSVTELEFHYGALQHPNPLGTLLLLRENFSGSVPDEYRHQFVSSPEHLDRLGELKHRVRATNNFQTYSARWGGLIDGKPMATGLEQFREIVTKKLKRDIDQMFPNSDQELSPLEIDQNLHSQVLETRSRKFVGRSELLGEMFKFADTDGAVGPLVIHGKPGFGKSALTAKFCRDYAERRPGAFIIPHFVGAVPNSSDIRHTIWKICSILKKEYQIGEEVPENYKDLKQAFCRFLEQSAFGRPCIIVLDSIHLFSAENRAQSLEWLPSGSPVKIIVSTYSSSSPYEVLRLRQPELPMIEVGALSEVERKDLVRLTLGEYRKKLEESPTNNQMRMLLRKTDSQKPLWLTIACEELIVGSSWFKNHETPTVVLFVFIACW